MGGYCPPSSKQTPHLLITAGLFEQRDTVLQSSILFSRPQWLYRHSFHIFLLLHWLRGLVYRIESPSPAELVPRLKPPQVIEAARRSEPVGGGG